MYSDIVWERSWSAPPCYRNYNWCFLYKTEFMLFFSYQYGASTFALKSPKPFVVKKLWVQCAYISYSYPALSYCCKIHPGYLFQSSCISCVRAFSVYMPRHQFALNAYQDLLRSNLIINVKILTRKTLYKKNNYQRFYNLAVITILLLISRRLYSSGELG